jgi:hypothetical protein
MLLRQGFTRERQVVRMTRTSHLHHLTSRKVDDDLAHHPERGAMSGDGQDEVAVFIQVVPVWTDFQVDEGFARSIGLGMGRVPDVELHAIAVLEGPCLHPSTKVEAKFGSIGTDERIRDVSIERDHLLVAVAIRGCLCLHRGFLRSAGEGLIPTRRDGDHANQDGHRPHSRPHNVLLSEYRFS